MAKEHILEGGKRDELIITAKELFLENGYEGTSVRMIVNNVGGEIGMFYHYFKSKDEIFDEAIKLFFTQYEQSFSDILSNGTIPQNSIIDLIFELFRKSLHEYKILKAGNFHWSMRIALNQLTLQSLIPYVSKYISKCATEER